MSSEFLSILRSRGFIHQITDPGNLEAALDREPITAYVGFDLTAESLHVGHLLPIMMLYWLQQTGHRPVVLLGGGTSRIGDPSGKTEARKLLTDDDLRRNRDGITRCFSHLLRFGDNANDALMIDNAEWLDDLDFISFMRDVGRHFSLGRMLGTESVRSRMESGQGLSFLEFGYPLLQAFDFVSLFEKTGCRLQMGGSDQWGNIVAGVDLGRRRKTAPLFGLTSPLITTSSGAKMGKTASGAVWLKESLTSIFDYYQSWRNTLDEDVPRFLKFFTTLGLDEINRLSSLEGKELNEAKKVLAYEACALVHGKEAAKKVVEAAISTFERNEMATDLPSISVPAESLVSGIGILELCVRAGFASSNGEARRLIRNRGLKVNGTTIDDERHRIREADRTDAGSLILSLGKKRYVNVVTQSIKPATT